MKKIWANTIIRNEERYIWFSISSVIKYVDKILVYDTGSTDKTIEIVKELIKKNPDKILLKEVGNVDIHEYTEMRQKMLKETKSDWLLILDGDEVWWNDSIKNIVKEINKNGDNLDTIVSPYFNVVGDMFHFQENKANKYIIDDKEGCVTIRAMNRKIPGLHQEKPHGQQGFYDGKGILIQEMVKERRKFLDYPFMHFTHMIRSSSLSSDKVVPKRGMKFKHEIGQSFPLDFYYPEVFFRETPSIVPSPWFDTESSYKFLSYIQTPLRMIKRRLFSGKVGY